MVKKKDIVGFIFFIIWLAFLVSGVLSKFSLYSFLSQYISVAFLIVSIIFFMKPEERQIRPLFRWLGIFLISLWFLGFLILLWRFQFISLGLRIY